MRSLCRVGFLCGGWGDVAGRAEHVVRVVCLLDLGQPIPSWSSPGSSQDPDTVTMNGASRCGNADSLVPLRSTAPRRHSTSMDPVREGLRPELAISRSMASSHSSARYPDLV